MLSITHWSHSESPFEAKTCTRQMDAFIQGVLLLRMVPVMATVATFSRFPKNQSRSDQLEAAWEKPELLIKLYTEWQGQKQGGVCCAEEMAEEIITTKETLPPIHSLTFYSPSSLPICNHTPGYLFVSPPEHLCY